MPCRFRGGRGYKWFDVALLWVKGSEGRESIVQVDFGVRCIRVGVVAGRSVGVGAGGIGVGVGLILQCWEEVDFDRARCRW